MAIVGLGTDIVEIERIKKALARSGEAFAERILTPSELVILKTTQRPERFLSKRFAAKEAASKALGTGIAHGVSFQHFSIINDTNGKPELILSGRAKEFATLANVNSIHLSLSDERYYAMATVILES